MSTRKEFNQDNVIDAAGSNVDIEELKFRFTKAEGVDPIELQNYISYTCHNGDKTETWATI